VDFERVLKTLLPEFQRHGIRYAAIGGFAVGVLGAFRATMDLDFLVHRDDLDTLHGVLTAQGYRRILQTENVSHYDHPDALWGSLDFIHAIRTASLGMLRRVQRIPLFEATQTVSVARPEDVIGLKVQAMVNNPERGFRERDDIRRLMALHGPSLDWPSILEYFELFDLGDEGRALREQFGHAR
jgi:hypothetical protein